MSDLRWTDIKSSTMNPDEFLQKHKSLTRNYENYQPNPEVLEVINKIISNKNERLKILSISADWCPDSALNVPRMVKIVKMLNSEDLEMRILSGVNRNYKQTRYGDSPWQPKPPEAVDPKFNLNAVPAFYFFNKNGEYVGRIVERPRKFGTLEEEIADILKLGP